MGINEAAYAARVSRRIRARGVQMTFTGQGKVYDPIEEKYTDASTSIKLYGLMFPPTSDDIARLETPQAQSDKERQVIYTEVPATGEAMLQLADKVEVPNAGTWTIVKGARLAPNGRSLMWSFLVQQ